MAWRSGDYPRTRPVVPSPFPPSEHTGIAMSAKSTLSPQFIAAQRKRLEALKAELLGADSTAQEEMRAGQEDGGAEAEEYEDAG